jgi:adenylate kinase family enzyme
MDLEAVKGRVYLRHMRVAILGNSGSGKSTLARQLAEGTGAAVLDLDTIVWEPDQVAVARDPAAVAADLERFCHEHDAWIVEGCYGDLIERVLGFGPRLVFLDPGEEACLANCKARPWEPHKYASREEQDQRLAFLLGWVSAYYQRDDAMSHVRHRAIYEAYLGEKQRLP